MIMKKYLQKILTRGAVSVELMGLLWEHKLWWMIPIVIILLLFFVIIIFGQATGIGAFIYPLF